MQMQDTSSPVATDTQYTSGTWTVDAGQEDRFVATWTRFTKWSLENAPGAQEFVLIRDAEDPRRFVSFGAWDDAASVTAWRQTEEFGRLFGECRQLCTDFHAENFSLASEARARS